MTIWFASPPEVHSALLSTGPGPAALLSAATAWEALSSEYASAAAELAAVVQAVGLQWEGASATQYSAAHVPYLNWLATASTNAAGTAVAHQTAAASYHTALATMPTMAELAANKATHAALMGTNFLGMNTIPIALNEADYARMWIQAATTMTVYQATSEAAVGSAPQPAPAPDLVNPLSTFEFRDPIAELLKDSEHFSSMWQALKDLVSNPVGTLVQLVIDFATSPSTAIVTWQPLFFVFAYAATFALIGSPLYPVFMAPAAIGMLGLLGLVELAYPQHAAAPALDVPAGQPATWPVASVAPTVTTPAAPTAPSSVPGPAPASAPATPAGSAATPGVPAPMYLVPGGDPPRSTPELRTGAVAYSGAAATATAAAGLAAANRARQKSRRRRGSVVTARGHRNEYLTMDEDVTPVAPDRQRIGESASGATTLGFIGAATTHADANGMTTLPGDAFGNGPAVPMMPSTWEADKGAT